MARSVLRALAAEQPDQLPRFESKTSGAVFAKLIYEEFGRRSGSEGVLGSTSYGELKRMNPDQLVGLIQSDTLEAIYAPQGTGGRPFDREIVQLASARLAQTIELRSYIQSRLAEAEAAPVPGRDFAAGYRESLQISEQVLHVELGMLVGFAVADRFTPAGRSDAVAHFIDQIPRIVPPLSPEADARLGEIIRGASASPGAGQELEELSRQW